jgi:AcrR family transcriptional regulator
MVEQLGRRERKKAATRRAIADAALRLFLERGYDAVGVREVAEAADVATTTLFAHFGSKEALVFDRDEEQEAALVSAITEREPGVSIPEALRRKLHTLLGAEYGEPELAEFRGLVESTPALGEYASRMWLRHEQALAAAIAAQLDLGEPSPACRALARFALDIRDLVQPGENTAAVIDEVFVLLTAGWEAHQRANDVSAN